MYAAAGALPYYVFKPKPASQTGHKLTSFRASVSEKHCIFVRILFTGPKFTRKKNTQNKGKQPILLQKNFSSFCKMHIDKCIKFYRVVKRLMYCGSVRLCQFDSFWVHFTTTNRVVRMAWIALNAKLTFLGPCLHSSRECILFTHRHLFSLGQFSLSGGRVDNVIQQTAFFGTQIYLLRTPLLISSSKGKLI